MALSYALRLGYKPRIKVAVVADECHRREKGSFGIRDPTNFSVKLLALSVEQNVITCSAMRKDDAGGCGRSAIAMASSPFYLSCLVPKPFFTSLVAVTLLVAIWQLQPYGILLSTPACPVTTESTGTSTSATAGAVATQNPRREQKISSADPNKRVLQPYGSAAALFVHMGSYRGGPNTFAVVGLASKPTHVFGRPWFKCEWVPNNLSSTTIRTKALKILPDWGYGRVYTVVVVNCTFAQVPNLDNYGGKLFVNAYYSPSPRKYEKILALEEAPGSYDESKFRPPFKYDYLYCGSSLYGNLSASRMREWIAYHAYFFGPKSHFVFHNAGGISPEVWRVLGPWVKSGWATVQDIRGQAEYDGYYYNQFLVVNDCLHRYRHAANWTFFFDVDEYLFLPGGRSLASVMEEFSDYTQFTIEQNPMSSKLCVKDAKERYSREWGFEKLVFRNSIARVRRDRKYAIQAKNAYATGVHMSENVIGKTLHKTEKEIRYFHYHDSINVLGEPCQELIPMPTEGNVTWFDKVPYIYDDSMKRVAEKVKQFESRTIGSL